jgi:succinate-acetate transporter protein
MPATLANPVPVGLIAFGLTNMLLSLSNTGLYPVSSPIIAQALFLGGSAQVLAGIMSFVRGNTFDTVCFVLFGGYWISFAFSSILPALGLADPPSAAIMGAFNFLWAVCVFLLTLGVLRGAGLLTIVMVTLTILLVILAFASWTGSEVIKKIAGFEGLLCGGTAFYLGCATCLEETAKKKILPC